MNICYEPIGFFSCPEKSPVESPRQGVLTESFGQVRLRDKIIKDCLKDLASFERIWLLYHFHRNETWKPLVVPPRGSSEKRGVFSTRSPYRPNGIGISCVKLESVEERVIKVSQHDLLDGTPILDIKPYLSYSDSFPGAKLGWLEDLIEYPVYFSQDVREKLNWLKVRLGLDVENIVKNQLGFEPLNKKIKRVKLQAKDYVFSYKTWRFLFSIKDQAVEVKDLFSGYSDFEINSAEDPYQDKAIHKSFIQQFGCQQ